MKTGAPTNFHPTNTSLSEQQTPVKIYPIIPTNSNENTKSNKEDAALNLQNLS